MYSKKPAQWQAEFQPDPIAEFQHDGFAGFQLDGIAEFQPDVMRSSALWHA